MKDSGYQRPGFWMSGVKFRPVLSSFRALSIVLLDWGRMVMNKSRKLILCTALAAFCFYTSLQAADSNLTPLPGTPMRKAVLDALRLEVKRIHGLDVVFVVIHLKVKEGWAWAHTRPQSPDGSSRYEDVSALLQRRNDNWTVVEIPCGEKENPDCLTGPDYFSRLQGRFPSVPTAIFPSWAHGVKDE
jgi:hypothetical protein